MKILISNDDGVNARGIKALANRLCMRHEVRVCAPYQNCSGYSHSLTVREGMKLHRGADGYDERVEVFALCGTPADCVKFGLDYKKDFVPDVVITGINDGPNLAKDIMYSGTVGAATEGALHDVAAVAVSAASHASCTHFETAARVCDEYFEKLIALDNTCVWNINVPDVPYEELRGVRFVKTGVLHYEDIYDKTSDGDDESYYLGGEPLKSQTHNLETDVGAAYSGYVAITPLIVDRTKENVLQRAKRELE